MRDAMRRVEFPSAIAAARPAQESRDRHWLQPREAYVLRLAPIHGLRRRGLTLRIVRDEDLSKVVDGLLRRGLLALCADAGPPCADLTTEGRAAIDASRPGAPR